MALIKFGGGVASASGKIDGTVYSRNRAGAIARGWTKPTNPMTELQTQVRARFSSVASAWSALLITEKQAWNTAASSLTRLNRLGEAYVPTGRQLFLEVNNTILANTGTLITIPPADFNPPIVPETTPGIEVEVTAGDITGITTSGFPVPASSILVIEATPPLPPNKINVNNLYRRVGSYTPVAAPVILTDYTGQITPQAAVGQVIWWRLKFYKTANGVLTTPIDTFSQVL